MIILYITLADSALVGLVVFLIFRLTRTRDALHAARQEASRARARQEAAKNAAREAEQRCQELLGHVEDSVTHAGQALNIAGQIEAVSQQLHDLAWWITQPLDAAPGKHELLPDDAGRYALANGQAQIGHGQKEYEIVP
jgi:hypothetical protein